MSRSLLTPGSSLPGVFFCGSVRARGLHTYQARTAPSFRTRRRRPQGRRRLRSVQHAPRRPYSLLIFEAVRQNGGTGTYGLIVTHVRHVAPDATDRAIMAALYTVVVDNRLPSLPPCTVGRLVGISGLVKESRTSPALLGFYLGWVVRGATVALEGQLAGSSVRLPCCRMGPLRPLILPTLQPQKVAASNRGLENCPRQGVRG